MYFSASEPKASVFLRNPCTTAEGWRKSWEILWLPMKHYETISDMP